MPITWWRYDRTASLHDRVRFHVWRALILGVIVGLILWSYPGGVIFALAYGPISAGMDELRRRHQLKRGG